mgnify:CR=1 FL=1
MSLILPPYMYILAFLSSFGFVFLKSFQQLNVVKKAYMLIVPTSMLMAVAEVYIVATTARNGWQWGLVFLIGLGSGLGSVSATWLHSRYVKEN